MKIGIKTILVAVGITAFAGTQLAPSQSIRVAESKARSDRIDELYAEAPAPVVHPNVVTCRNHWTTYLNRTMVHKVPHTWKTLNHYVGNVVVARRDSGIVVEVLVHEGERRCSRGKNER